MTNELTKLNREVIDAWEANADYWNERMSEGNDFHEILIKPSQLRLLQIKKDEEILVMGDFFTGNIVAYNNEKFRVLAKGMRGADAVEFGKGVIYVSSWPLGKVWKYDRKSNKLTVLSDKFTTAADFFYDRKNKQLIIPDMLGGTLTFLPVE